MATTARAKKYSNGRKVATAVLCVLGVFVLAASLGASSWVLTALGVALVGGGIALWVVSWAADARVVTTLGRGRPAPVERAISEVEMPVPVSVGGGPAPAPAGGVAAPMGTAPVDIGDSSPYIEMDLQLPPEAWPAGTARDPRGDDLSQAPPGAVPHTGSNLLPGGRSHDNVPNPGAPMGTTPVANTDPTGTGRRRPSPFPSPRPRTPAEDSELPPVAHPSAGGITAYPLPTQPDHQTHPGPGPTPDTTDFPPGQVSGAGSDIPTPRSRPGQDSTPDEGSALRPGTDPADWVGTGPAEWDGEDPPERPATGEHRPPDLSALEPQPFSPPVLDPPVLGRQVFDPPSSDPRVFDPPPFDHQTMDAPTFEPRPFQPRPFEPPSSEPPLIDPPPFAAPPSAPDFESRGSDAQGFPAPGIESQGLESQGLSRVAGLESQGFESQGFESQGFDSQGYDAGLQSQGYSSQSPDAAPGFAAPGHETQGPDAQGFGSQGYGLPGSEPQGFEPQGFEAQGFEAQGFEGQGFEAQGFGPQGFGMPGDGARAFDPDRNPNGRDPDRLDMDRLDLDGLDLDRLGLAGLDLAGLDLTGLDLPDLSVPGTSPPGLDPPAIDPPVRDLPAHELPVRDLPRDQTTPRQPQMDLSGLDLPGPVPPVEPLPRPRPAPSPTPRSTPRPSPRPPSGPASGTVPQTVNGSGRPDARPVTRGRILRLIPAQPAVAAMPDAGGTEKISNAYQRVTLPPGAPHRDPHDAAQLTVHNLGEAVRFYRDDLGLVQVHVGTHLAMLRCGESPLTLKIDRRAKPGRGSLIHLMLEVDNVQAAYQALVARGVTFVHEPRVVSRYHDLELWSAAFRDPDGHGLALIRWDVPPT